MRKPILSVLVFALAALSACLSAPPEQTSEVLPAVSTSTPPPTEIPLPTPHPDFLSLQDQIAAGGETFTLNQNGEIEMQTEEGMTIVPDIQIHPDGTISFTHDGQEFQADPDTLTIEGQTITFKDTEGKTWVFDGENWGDKTAEVKLAEDMEIFNLSLDDYKIAYDAEGKIELRDKSNKLVYWDGKWNSKEIVKIIKVANICKPTEFVASSQMPREANDYIWSILHAIRKTDRFKATNPRPAYDEFGYFNYNPVPFPLGGYNNCWIVYVQPTNPKQPINFVAFETLDGEIIGVPLFAP